MPIDYALLGSKIAFYRSKAALSQDKLADMLHVNRYHVVKIEMGRSHPSPDLLVDIANVLNVTVDDLLADSLQHRSDSDKISGVLSNCSPTEEAIIVRNAESLKKILDDLDVK